ncbi:MAG TPA: DUF4389 domain-containing protein [Streptosporangiaceae bacterium]|jgi:Domain of unknown function (DUF4389)|nr:DUF4389 domain-containing protein [Streptosporangiaceae bacterium]
MSAYYAADATAPVTEQSTPAPVLVAFAGSAPQSRLTVAFRIFLAIPQLIVLWLLGVAAGVITIIGWFGALFTGRLPVFAADFLSGYLRWLSRVYAYNYLLTDAYPPFTLDDADYPVRLAVMPGRLNRLAVLFRFFLLIPCWIVQAVVSYGALTIFMFVTWLIVLVTGQMPDAIHQGLAAVLRYQVRTLGFAMMLTSAYPGGLFGDAPAQPGYGDPQAQPGYGAQPGYAQAGYAAPAAGPASGLSWRLVLSAAARKLVILFIVLGAVLAAVNGAVQAALAGNSVSALSAAKQVVADIGPSRDALDNYSASVQACNNKLSCVEGVDRNVAATLNTFAAQLRGIAMPSQATAANAALAAAVSDTAAKFAKLSTAPTATKYISEARAAGLQQSVDKINQAYDNLGTALSS